MLDVGANDGGYATAIRRHGYDGRIASFEPVNEPLERLRKKASHDPGWDVLPYAVGATSGETVTINVAGNAAASSSLLPMLDRHKAAAPSAAYVAQQEVALRALDDVVPGITEDSEQRLFLKIDVQGYEGAVLDGAKGLLASGRVVGLQMELSFVPLYEGGLSWREGLDRAADLGMTLMSLDRGFTDPDGQMLQADGVFFRD